MLTTKSLFLFLTMYLTSFTHFTLPLLVTTNLLSVAVVCLFWFYLFICVSVVVVFRFSVLDSTYE